jgi:PKD repeat protein
MMRAPGRRGKRRGSRKMNSSFSKIVLTLFVTAMLSTKAVPQIPIPEPTQQGKWYIETVDSVGNVGVFTSIALDKRGFPQISYRDNTNQALKYAKWRGIDWQIETVDSDGNVGNFTSIDLDRNGYPHISYFDKKNEDLKYARWTGTTWEIDVVDSAGNVGYTSSIALDSNDNPHIGYAEEHPIHDLKYAKWDGTKWNIETVDFEDEVGRGASIAIDSNDYPHISYGDIENSNPKYARWTGSKWSIETVDASGHLVGGPLALDSNDHPHICYMAYPNYDLTYAKWNGNSWQIETVDWVDNTTGCDSIALDSNDYPHMSYLEHTNYDLKYARWTGSSWNIETVDSGDYVGWYSYIAIDGDDNPHISYHDYHHNYDLKYATKANLRANRPPVADAGPDQTANAGDTVQFDGSGSYDPDDDWETAVVDSDGETGGYSSTALDINNYPHMSYYDYDNGSLRYARWTGSTWLKDTVDSADYPGHTSLALDSGGNPHISYKGDSALKYARWDGTAWVIETVDNTSIVARWGSMVLDSSDHPHIGYNDWTSKDLKYARWDGSSWNVEVVDSADSVGRWASIAVGSNDHPHISYFDYTHGDLKYATWTGTVWQIETVDSPKNVGRGNSIALDSNDNPYISYHDYSNRDLRLAKWDGASWHIENVDFIGDLGYTTSLALDSKDYPHISYHERVEGDLKYAKWDGIGWWIYIVDSADFVGGDSSLAIDSSGNSHIGYHDATNGDLKYARRGSGSVSYDWDFGDGSPHGAGARPTHIYANPGIYEVNLTVTDTEGATDSDICIITVIQIGNQPPVADAGPDQTVYVGEVVQFDGSGSYDLDATWRNLTVDSNGSFQGQASLALDGGDNPHLSYEDTINDNLKYARWTGFNWLTEAVDPAYKTGISSIALDGNDYPHIAYGYESAKLIRYAKWTGIAWNIETVDTGRGQLTMALDSNDLPHMVYQDASNQTLKYTKWNGTAWNIEAVDPGYRVQFGLSLALDSNDHPHIAYQADLPYLSLRYARWNGTAWSIETVDFRQLTGYQTSIAIDSNDCPHISHFLIVNATTQALIYTKWDGTTWENETIDIGSEVGKHSSISIDSRDNPHISYQGFTYPVGIYEGLKYAKWDGTTWNLEVVDPDAYTGGRTSLAIDAKDNPHIGYVNQLTKHLKYATKGKGIVSYEWDFDDGSPHGSGMRPTHIYTNPGLYNVTLTVTDAEGATDTDNCFVTVLERNRPPVADANGPYYVDEGSPAILDGSSSNDPDNDTLRYRWDLDNDGIWDTAWSLSPTVDNTWMDDGTYTVVLQVKDAHNESDTDNATVYVRDLAPTAEFTWSPEPQNEGSSVQFTDKSASYPDAVTSWSWEFGDGGTSTDQNPNHIYADNGVFSVTLTVEDEDDIRWKLHRSRDAGHSHI